MNFYISHDSVKGRGVYTLEPIAKGTIIEVCEVIFIKLADVPDALEGYVFEYTKTMAALALGNGSLYNHSGRPNSHFYFRNKLLYFKADKNIKANEEITVSYGYSQAEKRKFKIR